MNRNKAIKNIIVATIFRIILLVINLILRRFLLSSVGSEAVGLFSLYTSIIGFLAIAELGIGTAISFSMYKPLINNENDKISALYYLYRRVYYIIFVIVMLIGVALTPFIPSLAKENTGTFNIQFTYIVFLFSTLTTYLFAHKTSFINANLDDYITISIRSIFVILEVIAQIIVLKIVSENNIRNAFNLFMLVILISNILQLIVTYYIFGKKYKFKINNNKIIDNNIKIEVGNKTKAMFFHKIGGLLVNTTDSIIISGFIGVTALGIYSNYVTLSMGLVSILSLVFTSIISVIGHSYAKNSKSVFYNQFKYIYIINYVLGFVFFNGFYAVVNESIIILFGKNNSLILSDLTVITITINYFIMFMRYSVLSFRDASGTFYNDRYKPLFEGITNLILSLIFVKFLGVVGVLFATIITNLFITHLVEPYVLYKYGFESSPKKYYLYNYTGILLFTISIVTFKIFPVRKFENVYLNFLINGLTSVIISFVFLALIYILVKDFRIKVKYIFKQGKIAFKSLLKKK